MMTPQEINTIMATEIMGWKLDKTQYLTKEKHKGGRKLFHHFIMFKNEWNPYEKIDQAFMCLHKWRESHSEWIFCVYPQFCELSNYRADEPFITGDRFPEEHEAQAICDCLIKAIEA